MAVPIRWPNNAGLQEECGGIDSLCWHQDAASRDSFPPFQARRVSGILFYSSSELANRYERSKLGFEFQVVLAAVWKGVHPVPSAANYLSKSVHSSTNIGLFVITQTPPDAWSCSMTLSNTKQMWTHWTISLPSASNSFHAEWHKGIVSECKDHLDKDSTSYFQWSGFLGGFSAWLSFWSVQFVVCVQYNKTRVNQATSVVSFPRYIIHMCNIRRVLRHLVHISWISLCLNPFICETLHLILPSGHVIYENGWRLLDKDD